MQDDLVSVASYILVGVSGVCAMCVLWWLVSESSDVEFFEAPLPPEEDEP